MDSYELQKMRDAAERRFSFMWEKMRQMIPQWREYQAAFNPARGRFGDNEYGRKPRKSSRRKNSAPRKISEEFAAGMQSGLASPSRPWFKLDLFGTRGVRSERVKSWLSETDRVMGSRLLQSNFYDEFVDFLREQGIFATSAMFIEEDDDDVFYCRTMTAGTYAVDVDYRGRVNRFARKLSYTAQQLDEDFGIEKLPRDIQNELKDRERRGNPTEYIVNHLIQPNEKYQTDKLGPPGMKWQSLWWLEKKGEAPEFLRISGYHEFPVIVGRWRVVAGDIYGSDHPAEVAIDDANTLQDVDQDSRGALERAVKPPMLAPRSLGGKLDNRPNAVNFYNAEAGIDPSIRPLFNVQFEHQAAENYIAALTYRIERAFYVDLFRMWATDNRQGRTATEIQAREAEKAYILAPITMRQTSQVLDKVIIRVYSILKRAGMLPLPPQELVGQNVRIEYVSEFALLQKRSSQAGYETLLNFAGVLSQLQAGSGAQPDIGDLIDGDRLIKDVAEGHIIAADVIRGDDAVASIREDRAVRAQQAQQMQMMDQAAGQVPGLAGAAKDMSETEMSGGGSALDALAAAVNGGAESAG